MIRETDLKTEQKSLLSDSLSSFTSPHLSPFSNRSGHLLFHQLPCFHGRGMKKKKKSHGKSNPLSSYPNLDGQPGGGQGRTPNWVLQFLSQPCFRELGPTFSKSSSFSVLRSSGGESTDTFSCLSLCTVK